MLRALNPIPASGLSIQKVKRTHPEDDDCGRMKRDRIRLQLVGLNIRSDFVAAGM